MGVQKYLHYPFLTIVGIAKLENKIELRYVREENEFCTKNGEWISLKSIMPEIKNPQMDLSLWYLIETDPGFAYLGN